MKLQLLKAYGKIDSTEYSLKEIALYFKKFNGYLIKIETTTKKIKVKLDENTLPHILGLQYAFANRKDSKEYKGAKGLEKLINGKITIEELKKNIKNNENSKVSWKMIQRRIEYLPMFLNTLEKNTRLKFISSEEICRNSSLKGKYALFKQVYEMGKTIFPTLSLKELDEEKIVIETFIIEDNISLLGSLKEDKIQKIELVSPLDSTYPQNVIKDKIEVIN